jgi:Kef-type K+ transport system membrane component KefB/Trk K+ transport system NAD-binding subunit
VEESINFVPLLLVLLFAFFVPLVLGRLRWLPVVVGEILAGVVIGHSGFNLVSEDPALDFMSNIGLAFLMFLAGMEIDFDRILPSRNGGHPSRNGDPGRRILTYALVVYLLTLGLSLPSGWLLQRVGLEANPFLISFILSATSLGVLLPILKERELTHTPAGQAIFFTAILADFVTVLLLTIFIITLEHGLNLQILTLGMLFLAFFLVYRILGRFFRISSVRRLIEELSHVTVQIKVRGAIAILMAFVALAGVLGVELILGAFLAGMIISLLKAPEDIDLVHKLEAFGFGFFIPVFFILVGVNLDLRVLFESPQSLLLLPVLLAMAVLVKFAPSILFRKILSWRETLAAASLLNTHLSLEIAVAVIGLRLGLLSEAANVTIVLFAILTVLLMPLLFNSWMPQRPAKEKRYMLLYGAEDLGMQVANVLRQHEENVRFLEPEPRLVEKARQAGFETLQADSIDECLVKAQKDPIQGLVVLSGEDTRNLLVCRAAANQGFENILAMVNDPGLLPEYRSLGVNTFTPAIYQPALLALMARSPDVFKLLTTSTGSQDVREIYLHNPLVAGQSLKTLGLPGNLLVLAVNRSGDIIIPHGSTRLECGDRLTLLGNPEGLSEAALWLEERKPA